MLPGTLWRLQTVCCYCDSFDGYSKGGVCGDIAMGDCDTVPLLCTIIDDEHVTLTPVFRFPPVEVLSVC